MRYIQKEEGIMKKLNFILVTAVIFIFASCNFPVINKGKLDFALDDETVSKFLDVAKDVAGTDYPITVEVNIHGRLEKNQTQVIKTKDDVSNLNFSFDIPKNFPSDVEVLVTIDKSVILYRGVTHGVKPDDYKGPVEVVLDQVFEIKKPVFKPCLNGSLIKFLRSRNFELMAMTEDGNRYPDCVIIEAAYEVVDDGDDHMIKFRGSNPRALPADAFNDMLLTYTLKNVTAKLAVEGFINAVANDTDQVIRPAYYGGSYYALPYFEESGSDIRLQLYRYLNPLNRSTDATNGYIDLTNTYADYALLSKNNYNPDNTTTHPAASYYLLQNITSGTQGVKQTNSANFRSNAEATKNDCVFSWSTPASDFKDLPTGIGKAIYYDNDNESLYVFERTGSKNKVFVYGKTGTGLSGTITDTVELADTENFDMKATVYDNKAYIVKYTASNFFEPVEVRVYSLTGPNKGQRISTIDIRNYCPFVVNPASWSESDFSSYRDVFNRTKRSYDILAWEDKIYVLYNEIGMYCNEASYDLYSTGISRGAVIEINPETNAYSRKLGWYDNPTRKIIRKLSDPYEKVPVYSPETTDSTQYFYGPQRFVALKPKKLVILDSGACVYVDNGAGTAKENFVNRIVEVDLENFCIDSVNPISFTDNPGFYPLVNYDAADYWSIENFYFAVKRANGSDFSILGSGSYLYLIE